MSSFRALPFSPLAALLMVLPLGSALADDRGPIAQDVQVSLGGFFLSTDTKVRLDASNDTTGTQIDWEDEFDLPDKDRFRLDAFWRFADRHKVRLMWFSNDRSGTRTTDREIEFGDTTYPVSTVVEAELDTDIIELAYEYAFLKREDLELSGSFGIHNVTFTAGLRGDVVTPGGGGSVEVEEKADTNGPLPVIGFRGLWRMAPNWYLDGLAQFFYIEFDDFTGSLYDIKAGVTWYPTQNFGVGLAYNVFATNLDVTKGEFSGELEMGYAGPMAYVTWGF